MFNRTVPYNSLPKLPPEGIDLETKPILREVADTVQEITKAVGRAQATRTNQSLALFLPAIEAQASSEMESVVTTVDDLLDSFAFASGSYGQANEEATGYLRALLDALGNQREIPMGFRLASHVCGKLFGNHEQEPVRRDAGTALRRAGSGEAIYTPPSGEQNILDLMSNWAQFVNDENDLHPLIRVAVAHYQFEAIHPFYDGNGRTGRIINMVLMHRSQILPEPVIYPSKYLLRHKQMYENCLRRVTENDDWEQWILFFLMALKMSAISSQLIILQIEEARKIIEGRIQKNRKSKLASGLLMDEIFRLPKCRTSQLVAAGIGTEKTCRKYLEELVSLGALRPVRKGKEVHYENIYLVKALRGDPADSSAR